MSKKNKKDLSPEQIRAKRTRRLMKKIRRLIMLALVVGAGYALYKPEIIPNAMMRGKVEGLRTTAIEQAPGLEDKLGGILGTATSEFNRVAKNTKLPKDLTGLPEEVVVEDVVKQFSVQIQHLPETQIKRIKTQICQDVIDDATTSANE